MCGARLHEIVQEFKGSQIGVLDETRYHLYSNELSKNNHVAPVETRFVLAEAIIAYRLVEMLDKDFKLQRSIEDFTNTTTLSVPQFTTPAAARSSADQAVSLLMKGTDGMIKSAPHPPGNDKAGLARIDSSVDEVGSAIMALCGAKYARFHKDGVKSFELLFKCRAGAYLGLECGMSKLSTYFKELFATISNFLPNDRKHEAWAQAVTGILNDWKYNVLVQLWEKIKAGFSYPKDQDRLGPIVREISAHRELLDCILPPSAFDHESEEKTWLEKRLTLYVELHGFASQTTAHIAQRFSHLSMRSNDSRESTRRYNS